MPVREPEWRENFQHSLHFNYCSLCCCRVLLVLTVVKKQKPEFKSTVRPIGAPTPTPTLPTPQPLPLLFPLISHTVGHTVLCPSCSAANRVAASVNVARLLSSRCADRGLPRPPPPIIPPPPHIADQSTSFQPPPTPPTPPSAAAAAPHRLLHLTAAHHPHHNLTDDYTCHSRQHVAN